MARGRIVMTMKKLLFFVTVLITAASCTKELEPSAADNHTLTISAGFERDAADGTKTYMKDYAAGTIWWGNTTQDKTLFVFDGSDTKNTFTSNSEQSEAIRRFTCDNWSGGDWKLAVWTGRNAGSDQCSLSGNILTGSTLKVNNPQTVSNSNSFNNTSNIAVMKPGDGSLKNVFGYLRFTLPTYPETTLAAIKSVVLSADENVAGDVRIDYSGANPVTTIIANGSTALTLNTRYKDSGPTGYEAGTVFMILPAGTYHHAKLTITPFTSTPNTQDATTGTPFTLDCNGDLVIQRGKYTDCGTLPAKKPWPNDSDAFDYGLSAGSTRKANISGLLGAQGAISEPVLHNGVTYGGPGMNYYGNRILSQKVASEWSTEYPDVIPASRYFSFKINRPGTVRFYPAPASKDGDVLRVPTYHLAVVTIVDGVTTAKIVRTFTPEASDIADGTISANRQDANVYSDDWQHFWVSIAISEEDIKGIDSATTVYLYHRNTAVNTLAVNYWPLEWTVAD